MRNLAIVVLVICTVATSLGYGETLNQSLMHDGDLREYTLYVPTGYTADNITALVVNLHGFTFDRNHQMQISNMNSVAEQEGFIVAYPDAVNGNWFGGEDNVGFIDVLIDAISSDYTINQSRLYATGFSQGGAMSFVLGVARADRFAAVASVAGTRFFASQDVLFPPDLPSVPDRPLPLLHVHGTADVIVPYIGGEGCCGVEFQAAEDAVREWTVNNGGVGVLGFTRLPDVDPSDSTTVDLFSCSDCGTYATASGENRVAEVLLYRINDGGHSWPGDFQPWPDDQWQGPPVNYDISGSTEIWDFFNRHELPATVFTAPGDFDDDGDVDGADFLMWQRDPSVASLAVWEADYGNVSGPVNLTLSTTSSTVPEPVTCTLLVLAMMTMLCHRREVVS